LQINLRKAINIALLIAAIIIFILAVSGAKLYTDWLWFQSLNYQKVFSTIIISEIGLRIAVGLVLFIFLFANLLFTRGPLIRATQKTTVSKEDDLLTIQNTPLSQFVTPGFLLLLFAALSIVMAVFFNFSVAKDWIILQQFLHPSPFGITDPVFNLDIGFYVFSLPFYLFLYNVASMTILGESRQDAAEYICALSSFLPGGSVFHY
jgi:uncharacterized membrane protein (UPF0182 family)